MYNNNVPTTNQGGAAIVVLISCYENSDEVLLVRSLGQWPQYNLSFVQVYLKIFVLGIKKTV